MTLHRSGSVLLYGIFWLWHKTVRPYKKHKHKITGKYPNILKSSRIYVKITWIYKGYIIGRKSENE